MCKRILLITILYCISAAGSANATTNSLYSGINIGIEQIAFKRYYGRDFFPKSTPMIELFLGTKQLSFFGLEVGANITENRTKDSYLNAGDQYPGSNFVLPAGVWQQWKPSYQASEVYLGINKFFCFGNRNQFSFFTVLAAAVTHIKAKIEFIDDSFPGTPPTEEVTSMRRTFSANKLLPIVKFGLTYNVQENWGIQTVYAWKYYSTFSGIKSSQNPNGSAEISLSNVSSICLGVYLLF